MQMIEIAKAFSYNAQIVIMDEPTSSLSEKEVEHLFKIIDKLKQRGCGIIYISHKMDEIFKICDEITILRDGKWINTVNVKESSMEQIVGMMVGRELTQRFPEKTNTPKEVILQVEILPLKINHQFKTYLLNYEKVKFSVLQALWGRNVPISLKLFLAYVN